MAKKLVCPKCGSRQAVEILYGYPSSEALEAAERGEIMLGGCCISLDDPKYCCKECDYSWGDGLKLELMLFMQTFKASVGGFFGPNYCVEADIKQGKVNYSCTEGGEGVASEKTITDEDWKKLITGLKRCDFEYWLDDYNDPGILDGTQWSVEVTFEGGAELRKRGSNSYPGRWKQFCRLMSRFIGERFS